VSIGGRELVFVLRRCWINTERVGDGEVGGIDGNGGERVYSTVFMDRGLGKDVVDRCRVLELRGASGSWRSIVVTWIELTIIDGANVVYTILI
jgi:hypothetical protein